MATNRRVFLLGCLGSTLLLILAGRYLMIRQFSSLEEAFVISSPYDITVVTLYVNIGKFQKGTGNYYYTPDSYRTWMKSWGMMTNRVIGFFENNDTLEYFRSIRSSQPADKTVLIQVNRSDLPAFNNLERIRTIFKLPGYPRHPPNTVVPEYSCAMNAKYDALTMAMNRGLVHTKYIAWVDIGLFRHLLNDNMRPKHNTFTLQAPDNFDPECVSMSEVTPRGHLINVNPHDYIYNNIVWVGGAFSLATTEVMRKHARSYKKTVEKLLARNLSSTDQQVIGSMFSPEYIKDVEVQLKPYNCYNGQYGLYGSDIKYFCLGYACKDASALRQMNQTNIK